MLVQGRKEYPLLCRIGKKYLIVQNSDQAYMEFPGIISKGYKMPEDDTFFVDRKSVV